MNKFNMYLKQRDFLSIEKIFLKQLEVNKSEDILFKMAMLQLQFPIVDIDKSIYYLSEICKKDIMNFEAIIIKIYLQYYYYKKMDNLYYYLISEDWKDNKRKAIVQFIISWYTDDCDKKEMFLKKSIEYHSKYVFPFEKLGNIYREKNMNLQANEYYKKALKNVISTKFPIYSSLDKDIFIEEYILGIRLSEENFDSINKKIEQTNEKI